MEVRGETALTVALSTAVNPVTEDLVSKNHPPFDLPPSTPDVKTATLWQVLLIAGLWRVAVAGAGLAGHALLPTGRFERFSPLRHGWPSNPFMMVIESGVHNDALWYARIAQHGYFYSVHKPSSIAFYPAYPLLIRAAMVLTGNVFVAGMLISSVCIFGGTIALWAWLRQRGLEHVAPLATATLLLFPWSMFFAAMYTEALYLLLALLSFLFFEQRRWSAATITTALLVLTRPTGILILPCLLLLAIELRPRHRASFLPLAGGLFAFAAFSAYQWRVFGTPIASARAASVWPWSRTLRQGLEDITFHAHFAMPTWYLAYMLGIGILVLLTAPLASKYFGRPYALFVALSVVLPAASGFQSLERYGAVAFPAFAALAMIRSGRFRVALMTAEAWLLLLMSAAFAAGWGVY